MPTLSDARAAVQAALAKCKSATTAAAFEVAVDEAKIAIAYFDYLLREEGKPPGMSG
jgi:hypothetical protein